MYFRSMSHSIFNFRDITGQKGIKYFSKIRIITINVNLRYHLIQMTMGTINRVTTNVTITKVDNKVKENISESKPKSRDQTNWVY